VNFVHIGDSHIQADMMTSVIRNALQNQFGNAGRGLVFPYQAAKTNGPNDYLFGSPYNWTSSRINKQSRPIEVGISGFGLQTNNNFSMLDFKQKQGIYFDKIRLISQKSSYGVDFYNPSDSIIFGFSKKSKSKWDAYDIILPYKIDAFQLHMHTDQMDSMNLFGVILENESQKGVLYHTIGANGAKYSDYFNNDFFKNQLTELKADCYIISMGTNEAQDNDLSYMDMYDIVEKSVAHIQSISPNTPIILSTPSCSYLKKKYPNPNLTTVRAAMEHFAFTHQLAFYDLFTICQCESQTDVWRTSNLLNNDLVHYTQKGYQLQGDLFNQAFANAWNYFIETKKSSKIEDK
jgi:lysophospholipase L1-like esterase